LAALREAGVSEGSLPRIIVIEFGSQASVFDTLSPEGYVVNGRWHPIEELGDDFM
jgi:hypothetical protein